MKHTVSETQICTNMAFKLSSENRNIKSSDNVTIYKKNLKGDTHGQANMDGTIDIDKSIDPNSSYGKKVIRHEKKHIEQIKSGKASYTDNTVTWNGKKYKREDGYIYGPNGKLEEGHPDHPWEKEAINAEKA